MRCDIQNKSDILNYLWLDNTTNNDIIISKISNTNLIPKALAATYLTEYHKFIFCLGQEYR